MCIGVSAAVAVHVAYINAVTIVKYDSNHSWVSFQGFCESYNDAFDLPGELGDDYYIMYYFLTYLFKLCNCMALYVQSSHHVLLERHFIMVNLRTSYVLLRKLTIGSNAIGIVRCVWRW